MHVCILHQHTCLCVQAHIYIHTHKEGELKIQNCFSQDAMLCACFSVHLRFLLLVLYHSIKLPTYCSAQVKCNFLQVFSELYEQRQFIFAYFFSSNALCVSSGWPLAGQWWHYSLVSKSNSCTQSLWSAMIYCHYFIHGGHLDFCSNSQLWKEMLRHISFSFTVECRQSHEKMRFSFLIPSNPSSISQKLPATCQHSLPLFWKKNELEPI